MFGACVASVYLMPGMESCTGHDVLCTVRCVRGLLLEYVEGWEVVEGQVKPDSYLRSDLTQDGHSHFQLGYCNRSTLVAGLSVKQRNYVNPELNNR